MKLPWKPTELYEWLASIAIAGIIIAGVIHFNEMIKGPEDANKGKVKVTIVDTNTIDSNDANK
jgi:hypothetical protein